MAVGKTGGHNSVMISWTVRPESGASPECPDAVKGTWAALPNDVSPAPPRLVVVATGSTTSVGTVLYTCNKYATPAHGRFGDRYAGMTFPAFPNAGPAITYFPIVKDAQFWKASVTELTQETEPQTFKYKFTGGAPLLWTQAGGSFQTTRGPRKDVTFAVVGDLNLANRWNDNMNLLTGDVAWGEKENGQLKTVVTRKKPEDGGGPRGL